MVEGDADRHALREAGGDLGLGGHALTLNLKVHGAGAGDAVALQASPQ